MKTDEELRIRAILEEHHNLSECVVHVMRWLDFGTTVEIVVNYVWDAGGRIREDLERPDLHTFKFRLVQELHIHNTLNEDMCKNPELINWGINEIVLAKMENENDSLQAYRFLPVPFHRIVFWFAGDRHIDIIFSELQVLPDQSVLG
jgi:hypothetical protein